MHKLEYKNGLLYTSIVLEYEDKPVIIDNVIVDTGATNTIILTDYLDPVSIVFSGKDKIVKTFGYGGEGYSSVRKRVKRLSLGDISVDSIEVDFGEIDPNERVNGLIGLNFLRSAGVIIDLVDFTIYKKDDLNG